jgi:hypothetical protein
MVVHWIPSGDIWHARMNMKSYETSHSIVGLLIMRGAGDLLNRRSLLKETINRLVTDLTIRKASPST